MGPCQRNAVKTAHSAVEQTFQIYIRCKQKILEYICFHFLLENMVIIGSFISSDQMKWVLVKKKFCNTISNAVKCWKIYGKMMYFAENEYFSAFSLLSMEIVALCKHRYCKKAACQKNAICTDNGDYQWITMNGKKHE